MRSQPDFLPPPYGHCILAGVSVTKKKLLRCGGGGGILFFDRSALRDLSEYFMRFTALLISCGEKEIETAAAAEEITYNERQEGGEKLDRQTGSMRNSPIWHWTKED